MIHLSKRLEAQFKGLDFHLPWQEVNMVYNYRADS